MTIPASSVIRRVTDTLQDTGVRWPVHELVRWLNESQRAISGARPDAINVTANVTLVAGPRQDLDSMGLSPAPLKLIAVQRNTAVTSNKAAVTLVQKHLMDAHKPSWYNATPDVSTAHYMFDVRDPKTFYVYPPATPSAQLEINYAAYPVDIVEPANGATYVDVMGNLSVPDIYDGVVVDLVLYRAYLKDSESAANQQRADSHRAAAGAALGVELTATLAVQPQIKPSSNNSRQA